MSTTAAVSRPPSIEASVFQTPQPRIDAETAKRLANRFILENLPDRFCAGVPRFLQFPLDEIKEIGKTIYDEKRADIEAAFLQARNA